MSTKNYLLVGVIATLVIIGIILAVADVPEIIAIALGILTLLAIPLVLSWTRKIPKKDYKHQDENEDQRH